MRKADTHLYVCAKHVVILIIPPRLQRRPRFERCLCLTKARAASHFASLRDADVAYDQAITRAPLLEGVNLLADITVVSAAYIRLVLVLGCLQTPWRCRGERCS